MIWFNRAVIALVSILSLAAGGAKLAQAPSEVAFFESLGLSIVLMMGLGAIQFGSGIAMVVNKTRFVATSIAAAAFLTSSLMIFATGNFHFGLISLLPFFAACYVARLSK